MNGHGIDTCKCGAEVSRCRCMNHDHKRVSYETCAKCRPGTKPVPIHGAPAQGADRFSDAVKNITKTALKGRRVSPEAWVAACEVTEALLHTIASDYIRVNEVDSVVRSVMAKNSLVAVPRSELTKLMDGLEAWGAGKSYPTDSATLKAVKQAYIELKFRIPAVQ